jgi:hypothetical protein
MRVPGRAFRVTILMTPSERDPMSYGTARLAIIEQVLEKPKKHDLVDCVKPTIVGQVSERDWNWEYSPVPREAQILLNASVQCSMLFVNEASRGEEY